MRLIEHHGKGLIAMALSLTFLFDCSSAFAIDIEEAASKVESLRQKRRQVIQTLLDKKQKKEQRLEAFREMVKRDREEFETLFHIFEDRDEDDDIRWAALRNQPLDEKLMAAELDVLRDASNGSAKFHANLISDLGSRARLQHHSKIFQNLMQTVRGLLTDQREEVKGAAIRFLTPMQDPAALELVVEGLRDPGKALVSISEAIELLHNAGAGNRTRVIRPYLDHPDTIVRAKAALVAAIDAESRPRIIRLLKDRSQPAEVRLASLRGLSGSDKTFPGYALEIIRDRSEEIEVRKAAINRFVGFMNYNPVAKTDQIEFTRVIHEMAVAEAAGPGSLGELAQQVSSYVQKSFPPVPE
jgi:hypothetical protein